jgi:hypothetical protein
VAGISIEAGIAQVPGDSSQSFQRSLHEGQKEQVLEPGQREDMLPAGLELVASNLKYGTGTTRNDFLDMSKKDHRS